MKNKMIRTSIIHTLLDKIELADEKHPTDLLNDYGLGMYHDNHGALKDLQASIEDMRQANYHNENGGSVDWCGVLHEECKEFKLEYRSGNRDRAIEELYDVATVAIRAIEFLSRQ